jgi:hypothetical protein
VELDAENAGENVSTGHETHANISETWATSSAYFPGIQAVQAAEPVDGLYFPTSQLLHRPP